jgi:hypothetical protein
LTYINGCRRRSAHDATRIDLAGTSADAIGRQKIFHDVSRADAAQDLRAKFFKPSSNRPTAKPKRNEPPEAARMVQRQPLPSEG